jgi:Phage integrase family
MKINDYIACHGGPGRKSYSTCTEVMLILLNPGSACKRRDGSLEFDWLPMTDHLFSALLGHLNSMENVWVFPNPETGIPYSARNKWMHRLCGKGGVKPFGLHSIRHLTASILEKENIPLSHIQRILRHKKLTTTERYIHRLSSLRTSLMLLPIPKGTPEKTPLNPIKQIQGLRQVA